MKAMTSGIIFLLCCLTTTGSLWAQGDTVQHRQLKSWLPDSTQVQYEIGQVTLSNAYGKKYIRFVDSSSLTPDVFLRSVAFIKQTADDTIEFTRFANFDN